MSTILNEELLKGIREKGLIAVARERIGRTGSSDSGGILGLGILGAPPAKPTAPPAAEAKIEKRPTVAVESIEGRYVPKAAPYAGPLTYESLSPSTKEWLTPGMWAELSSVEKLDALQGAGLGYEALKASLPWRSVEFYTPGKYQRGKIAVQM